MSEHLMKTMEKELNASQKEAVYFNNGPLLVIAGAGSGKTKTLTYRVARLIHEGIQPESILLLTFTRKASEEMLKRACNLLDHRCQNVSGGTFHAFANIALRKYASYINYSPDFTILDRSDCEDLIQMIRKEKGLGKSDKRFPKKGTLCSIISKGINTTQTIETIVSKDYPQFIHLVEDIKQVAIEYTLQKQTMQVMDYDDLLVKFVHCLQQNPEIKEAFRNHYKYIMVDEYQDTNSIQSQLIHCLVNNEQNIMVVGDDSQSIYSFRGAHFENIIQFPSLFPTAHIIKLEQNYRSTQPILNLTNAVIAEAEKKYTKNLFTENEGDQKPELVETGDENEQSEFICKKILELREKNVPMNKIAVLMRSGWHSNDLEVTLKSYQLPFVKMGGFKFIEASHIKDILSFLRIIYNITDTISWTRILLMLEGCGPGASYKITTYIKQNSKQIEGMMKQHNSKKYAKELLQLIHFSQNKLLRASKPKDILEKALTIYNPIFKLKYDDFNKRQTDLDSFLTISERYNDLETMLTEMSLDPPTETQDEALPTDNDNEKLTLSTIHSAKGLEWHTVFLISAIDGYLPSFQSLGDQHQIEEERRLMYVALTRAEKNLYIMKPNLDLSSSNHYRFSGMQFSKLSRFLDTENLTQNFMNRTISTSKPASKQFTFSMPDHIDTDPDDPLQKARSNRKYYF